MRLSSASVKLHQTCSKSPEIEFPGIPLLHFCVGRLLGALYDFDPVYLVIVSVAAQACSILFYVLCIKVRKA